MRIRRLAIAGVALAAAIGLSGCGTDKDSPSGAGTGPQPPSFVICCNSPVARATRQICATPERSDVK